MLDTNINLARKWRSGRFDQIVGQDVAVGILKNSLYLNKFFPVYLFTGQHGCGKTTTARVFAAATNCEKLPDFQANPQEHAIPCGTCASCRALTAGKHPDFIEIDAASNTGVDNVRTIIETASLMPLLGRKKIYLIDEAHMLSKAAFNAFLKILEEPPESVFFILATTDEHKIIETVKSRCFQLVFGAVETQILQAHLRLVCTTENIAHQEEALSRIIKETGGSVRDALNLLEQVHLSKKEITINAVQEILGHLSEESVHILCAGALKTPTRVDFILKIEKIGLDRYNADHVWTRILAHIHVLLWTKYGVTPPDGTLSQEHELVIQNIPTRVLSSSFDHLCAQEPIFLRTLNKPLFLKHTLVQLWNIAHETNGFESRQQAPSAQKITVEQSYTGSQAQPGPYTSAGLQPANTAKKLEEPRTEIALEPQKPQFKNPTNPSWIEFLEQVSAINEPLLISVLKQGQFAKHENDTVTVLFARRLILFKDTIESLKSKWSPILQLVFGPQANLDGQFTLTDQGQPTRSINTNTPTSITAQERSTQSTQSTRAQTSAGNYSNQPRIAGSRIDVSDKNQWPITHQLLQDFPGTITEVVESKPTMLQKTTTEIPPSSEF